MFLVVFRGDKLFDHSAGKRRVPWDQDAIRRSSSFNIAPSNSQTVRVDVRDFKIQLGVLGQRRGVQGAALGNQLLWIVDLNWIDLGSFAQTFADVGDLTGASAEQDRINFIPRLASRK